MKLSHRTLSKNLAQGLGLNPKKAMLILMFIYTFNIHYLKLGDIAELQIGPHGIEDQILEVEIVEK